MKKHLFFVLAVAGVGLYSFGADPPSEDNNTPLAQYFATDEPKNNTGEGTILPSSSNGSTAADVNSNSEFNEPSRSPAEMYAQMDPAFSKYLDLSLLAQAMTVPDASLLADVALAIAEGERVLVRNHRSGLNSEGLMARAVKLAARTGDKVTLERIERASNRLSKPKWAKLVTEAKEFVGVSRDGPMVALRKVDLSTAALLDRVRHACDVAELTGQKGELGDLKKDVAASDSDTTIKGHLSDMIDGCVHSLPEKADEAGKLLDEFSAGSRDHWITRPQDWGKKGVILSPSRPSESTSSLSVMSYATIRNPTSNELKYSVDGRLTTLQAGRKTTYTIGSNSGNVRPVSIRFENGRGVYKQYQVGDGSYSFRYTSNGLDLFRD